MEKDQYSRCQIILAGEPDSDEFAELIIHFQLREEMTYVTDDDYTVCNFVSLYDIDEAALVLSLENLRGVTRANYSIDQPTLSIAWPC